MIDIFKDKAFDVEHALVMYAKSFVTLPAFAIYEDEQIAPLLDQIRHCHIYIVGMTPKINPAGATQEGQELVTSLEIGGKRFDLRWPLPADVILKGNTENGWYVEDATGKKTFPGNVVSRASSRDGRASPGNPRVRELPR
jgi:hypothetical protein